MYVCSISVQAAEPIVRVDAEAIIGEGAAAPGDVRHEVASSWPVIVSGESLGVAGCLCLVSCWVWQDVSVW